MKDLSLSAAFDLALDQKSRSIGIPWVCSVCHHAGILLWNNDARLLDLMFEARHQHAGASPECSGHPLVIESALVFRRCR